MGTHRKTGDNTAFQQLVRIIANDIAVLACAGFGFVGIHHQKMRTVANFLGHERPFQARRESGTATPTQAGGLDPLDNLIVTKLEDFGCG